MGELIYQRVFSLAVWGIGLAAAMASVAAIGRTREADLPRTAALAALLLAMSVLLGRNAPRIYRAMRRRPALSLGPPGVTVLTKAPSVSSGRPRDARWSSVSVAISTPR